MFWISRGNRLVCGLAVAAVFGAAGDSAMASGFQLKEQGGAGLGNAFAGVTASGEDLSTMFFNPSGLTRLSGNRAMGSLSIIVPSAKFSAGASTDALGAALTGTNGGQGGEAAGIPALYAMWDYSSDLKLGLALNSPFGLVTSYDDNWVGRYHATTSSLKTFNLQPTVAYKLSPDRVPRRGVRAAVLSRSPAGSAGFMLPARPTA